MTELRRIFWGKLWGDWNTKVRICKKIFLQILKGFNRGVKGSMVFASLFFVCFFFTICLFVYESMSTIRQKNMVLLVFSLVFYAWGGLQYVFLLVGMTFAAWILALMAEQYQGSRQSTFCLILACVILIGLLCVFKYSGFVLEGVQFLFGVPEEIPEIVLPIGISFYTFQLLSYVVDVYRGEVAAQKRFWVLLLYAGLFHQCVAGPIVRYSTVAAELAHRRTRMSETAEGIWRFASGLAKKAILANGCALVADTFLPMDASALKDVPALGLWVGVLGYTLQIYLDFSAYSDMAVGMGLMVGLHYPENFNYPYLAGSVQEFWRRWHISLSSFFRDYVYIPLGGSRGSEWKTIRNLFITWGLTGLWHGAAWNYVVWGLYFFCFLVLERYWRRRNFQLPRGIRNLYTLLVVAFGWVLFRFTDFSNVGTAVKGMFGLNGNGFSNLETRIFLQNHCFLLLICILGCTPLLALLRNQLRYIGRRWKSRLGRLAYLAGALVPVILIILSVMALVGNSYNPFLYFQF